MSITATKFKSVTTTMIASAAILFASSSFAGPGKPGKNPFVEDGTIVDIALEVNTLTGEFSNLLAAVLCFGPVDNNPIVDLLSGEDKYTLFAPTDAAFDALLQGTNPCDLIEDMDAPTESTLFAVLAYHVVEGRRFSNSVFNSNNAKMIETLLGENITSSVVMETPILMDLAEQTVGVVPPFININAINGVIHTIDTVLLPIPPADE